MTSNEVCTYVSIRGQNLNLNLLALPGYLLAVVFLDVVGRYNLQVLGFVVVGAIFALLGFWAGQLQDHPTLYITLYALTFLFVDFEPNTTTLDAERGRGHKERKELFACSLAPKCRRKTTRSRTCPPAARTTCAIVTITILIVYSHN